MESCSDMLRSAPIYNLCYIKVLNEVPGKSVNFHSNHSKKKKKKRESRSITQMVRHNNSVFEFTNAEIFNNYNLGCLSI